MLNDFVGTQATATIGKLAVSAAILGTQLQYPSHVRAYQVEQTSSTFSSVKESLRAAVHGSGETFATEIASVFASFAKRQEPLGAEFEAAIFDNLEGLYEA